MSKKSKTVLVVFSLFLLVAIGQVYSSWFLCELDCWGECACWDDEDEVEEGPGPCCFSCIHWSGPIECCEGTSKWDSCLPEPL